MKAKLTPWFESDSKPMRKGVYQRRLGSIEPYSYWNGSHWSLYAFTPLEAEKDKRSTSCFQHSPWRGLASDPSKEPA